MPLLLPFVVFMLFLYFVRRLSYYIDDNNDIYGICCMLYALLLHYYITSCYIVFIVINGSIAPSSAYTRDFGTTVTTICIIFVVVPVFLPIVVLRSIQLRSR